MQYTKQKLGTQKQNLEQKKKPWNRKIKLGIEKKIVTEIKLGTETKLGTEKKKTRNRKIKLSTETKLGTEIKTWTAGSQETAGSQIIISRAFMHCDHVTGLWEGGRV